MNYSGIAGLVQAVADEAPKAYAAVSKRTVERVMKRYLLDKNMTALLKFMSEHNFCGICKELLAHPTSPPPPRNYPP